MGQKAIPYMQIRGGSSKGLYFDARHLPDQPERRDQILVAIMGRGERQIDGLGGAHPLTSKVALVQPSSHTHADVDFLFAQVIVGEDRVDTKPNCGNILAGVGPFAIESGMVEAEESETRVRVHMLNSDKFCDLVVQTPDKQVEYSGSTRIAGVPRAAAPILCRYQDTQGSACGVLLPTGQAADRITVDWGETIEVTCIDNGMPVVLIRADDLGVSGYETVEELDANDQLKAKLESLRMQLGPKMNLGSVQHKAVPKMCLVSKAQQGAAINTRTFIPHQCHSAIGVLGAVTVATACLTKGSIANRLSAELLPDNNGCVGVSIEHPSGEFTCMLETSKTGDELCITAAGLVRTARLLSRGETYIANTGD